MSEWYDKEGRPIGMLEWGRLLEDAEYKRVDRTALGDGREVSTVWLGLDHAALGRGQGTPVIFETMVFSRDNESLDCRRYSTLEEAKAGHAQVVAECQAGQHLPEGALQ
jgi:hypothetical protein